MSEDMFKGKYDSEYGQLFIRCKEGQLAAWVDMGMSADSELGLYDQATG